MEIMFFEFQTSESFITFLQDRVNVNIEVWKSQMLEGLVLVEEYAREFTQTEIFAVKWSECESLGGCFFDVDSCPALRIVIMRPAH